MQNELFWKIRTEMHIFSSLLGGLAPWTQLSSAIGQVLGEEPAQACKTQTGQVKDGGLAGNQPAGRWADVVLLCSDQRWFLPLERVRMLTLI